MIICAECNRPITELVHMEPGPRWHPPVLPLNLDAIKARLAVSHRTRSIGHQTNADMRWLIDKVEELDAEVDRLSNELTL